MPFLPPNQQRQSTGGKPACTCTQLKQVSKTTFHEYKKQVAAVLTVKSRIAATIYRIRLRILNIDHIPDIPCTLQ